MGQASHGRLLYRTPHRTPVDRCGPRDGDQHDPDLGFAGDHGSERFLDCDLRCGRRVDRFRRLRGVPCGSRDRGRALRARDVSGERHRGRRGVLGQRPLYLGRSACGRHRYRLAGFLSGTHRCLDLHQRAPDGHRWGIAGRACRRCERVFRRGIDVSPDEDRRGRRVRRRMAPLHRQQRPHAFERDWRYAQPLGR